MWLRSRSGWTCRLRSRFTAARWLGLRVRIPLTGMDVCVVFMTRSGESYRLCVSHCVVKYNNDTLHYNGTGRRDSTERKKTWLGNGTTSLCDSQHWWRLPVKKNIWVESDRNGLFCFTVVHILRGLMRPPIFMNYRVTATENAARCQHRCQQAYSRLSAFTVQQGHLRKTTNRDTVVCASNAQLRYLATLQTPGLGMAHFTVLHTEFTKGSFSFRMGYGLQDTRYSLK